MAKTKKEKIPFSTKSDRTKLRQNLSFIQSIGEENIGIIVRDNTYYSFDKFFIIETKINDILVNDGYIENINTISKEIEKANGIEEINTLINQNLTKDYNKERELFGKIDKIDKTGKPLVSIELDSGDIENFNNEISSYEDTYHSYPQFYLDKDKLSIQYQTERKEYDSSILKINNIGFPYILSMPYEVIREIKKLEYLKINIEEIDELGKFLVTLKSKMEFIDFTIKYLTLGKENIF